MKPKDRNEDSYRHNGIHTLSIRGKLNQATSFHLQPCLA